MVSKFWTLSRLTRLLFVGASLFLFAVPHASAAEARRVLLVHAFGHAYSPWSNIAGSFRAELIKKSKEPIDFYEVSLETGRVRNPQDEAPFVEYIHALLAGRRLDLIVPIGAPAAFFVQRHRQQLFPTTPMLIVGADRRRVPTSSLTENDAAVLSDLDLPAYLANILRLRPETTDIAVVVGNSPVERFWTSQLRRDIEPLADRVKIEWFNELTFDEMLQRAAAMPPNSAILWSLLSEDAAGIPYSQDGALETMRTISSVPVFGVGDYEMGRGIVGGPLLQSQKLGQQGADVALRLLQGDKPSAINSPYVIFGPSEYDWRELQRWGISESRLPAGSIVRFREPSVWERYRWQLIAIAATVLAQAGAIIWLYVERRRRRVAELELRQRLMEVIHLNRTALTGTLSASVAHELNQPLAAIQSNVEATMLFLKADPPNVRRAARVLGNVLMDNQRAAEIIAQLRSLLRKEDKIEVQDLDLNQVIHETLQIVGLEALKNNVELASYQSNGEWPVRANRVHLQQVLMNLAVNAIEAMRDCNRTDAKLSIKTVRIDDSLVEVSVADSGPGIPHDNVSKVFDAFYTTKRHGTGLGLSIARTIIETYGGKIWAENRAGGGAAFRFTLALTQNTAETADSDRRI